MRIAIIVSQFNKEIGQRLLDGAVKALKEENLDEKNYAVYEVPGAFEIPYAAAKICKSKKFDAAIALGCVIEGKTDHYRAICEGVSYGLQKIAVENGFAVMLGVLMCKNLGQALDRSGTDVHNKGYESAKSLVSLLKLSF